ncbi:MAG: glycoside hydrolase [Bacilli bacterium]|nr:glycoside hydrolase [Bacilli bacterium]
MKINALSLREKIGQMIMCGFQGTVPSGQIEQLIKDYHLGGIIYFRRNIADVQQVFALSASLQQISREKTAIPLLISIDQEGGMVARIDQDVTLMPGNMAIGASLDAQGAYDTALISGEELRLLGINMNFAPCIDVNNNPLNPVIGVRSYGEDAKLVADMGSAQIRGYQQSGVAATAKHFPGHGDTATDSHLDMPTVPHDKERLHEIELVPFKAAIANEVDAIMTAHVIFPAYEPDLIPATISQRILSDLLREELQFKGVIVTDCLEMNAISQGIGVAMGAVKAVEAGADIVLVSHLYERQIAAFDALLHAVEAGIIAEARIDQSVERILRLKEKRRMDQQESEWDQINQRISTEANWGVAQAVSEKSITLVKDDGQLPLDSNAAILTLWPEVRLGTEVDEIIPQEITLGKALSAYVGSVREIKMGTTPTAAEIAQVLEAAKEYSQIVVCTYNADTSPGQLQIITELAKLEGKRLVVAALRNPYDVIQFPQIKTYIACYENRPLAMKSLAKVLVGALAPQGKLPVTLTQP